MRNSATRKVRKSGRRKVPDREPKVLVAFEKEVLVGLFAATASEVESYTAENPSAYCKKLRSSRVKYLAGVASVHRSLQSFAPDSYLDRMASMFKAAALAFSFHCGKSFLPSIASAAHAPKYTESATPCPLYAPSTITSRSCACRRNTGSHLSAIRIGPPQR